MKETALDYTIPIMTGAHNKTPPTLKKPLTLKFVDDESGVERRDDEDLAEAKSSTERVRKYYRKNKHKVRKYLKKTQDDRVARNRDRRKAVAKHGKTKMKKHDVHHPNGPHNGGARIVRKDHGRDKVNEVFRMIISEGGAAGHMAHPYEDDSLTFAQVKEMIHRGLVGALDAEAPVTEKLDGQNIAFTIRDGEIKFARNKGQVKNRGQNALDVAGIRNMFAGRGNIERAFTGAAEDLRDAIAKMPPEQRDAIFGNGSKFMNVEIIFPDTKNVIPYDKSVLVFHGTIEYDQEGNEVGRSQDDAQAVHSALVKANADKQKTFGISGPHTISFSDTDTSRNKRKMQQYIRRMQRLQNEYGLDDDSTIEDYKRAWWGREIDAMGWNLNEFEREGLIDRWAMGIKKFGPKDIEDKELKKKIKEFEAEHVPSLQRKAAQPLERTFLQVGTDAMRRVTDFLGSNNPQLAAQLKKEVLDTIRELQNTDDQNKLAKLQQQVERLSRLGVDNIVPSEGMVFVYNGKPYKFTGTFAPVNQILGTLKFAAGKAEIVEPAEAPEKAAERKASPAGQPTVANKTPTNGPKRTVAIFAGRFQPFHAGHYSVYEALVEKFGKDNVYIASSDVTDPVRSPFGFDDKHEIITTMFDVPEDHVVQVANPYAPTEILEKLPPNTTYVTAVSQKDAERLGKSGKYFRPYEDGQSTEGYAERGYFIVAPEFQLTVNGKNISGTQLRQVMGDPQITERAKKEIFTKVYGRFNPNIFKKIVKTTAESEEARQLTTQYGDEKKGRAKKAAKKTAPKKTAAKKPDEKQMQSARDVLRQRIKNPKTGREIYVATALSYEPTDPMRKQAEKLVRQALARGKKKK